MKVIALFIFLRKWDLAIQILATKNSILKKIFVHTFFMHIVSFADVHMK